MCLVEILEKSADYSLYSVNNDDGNTHIHMPTVSSQLVDLFVENSLVVATV